MNNNILGSKNKYEQAAAPMPTLDDVEPIVMSGSSSGGRGFSFGLGRGFAGAFRGFGKVFGGSTGRQLDPHERGILAVVGLTGLTGSGFFILVWAHQFVPLLNKKDLDTAHNLASLIFVAIFTGIEVVGVATLLHKVEHTMITLLGIIALIGLDLLLTVWGSFIFWEVVKFQLDPNKTGFGSTLWALSCGVLAIFVPFYCLTKAARGR